MRARLGALPDRRTFTPAVEVVTEAVPARRDPTPRPVNAALAQLTENAAIVDGLNELFGAFPGHPDHDLGPTAR